MQCANRNIFVLVNPASGRRQPQRVLTQLEKRLRDLGIDYQVHETTAVSKGAGTVGRYLSAKHSDIIVIGGDGTLNEAANALPRDIPFGIIPSGTGNDYVKSLDIGKSAAEIIETAVFGDIAKVDLGLCNGRKFLNGVGIGIDGKVVFGLLHDNPALLTGHARYYYQLLKVLLTYRSQTVRYRRDDTAFNESALMSLTVAKGTTFGGGFRLTPNANLQDGLLHVCEIRDASLIKCCCNVGRVKRGTHGRLDEVAFHQVKTLEVAGNAALHAHIDGEYLGRPPFRFSVLPGAFSVRVRAA